MEKGRLYWIDNMKVFACLLVLLGHFFQSMTKANILSSGDFYYWFDRTIYYFHVPLFFVCSGYLYQKFSKVNSIKSWRNNLIKKIVELGIPYITFSFATWILKMFFASSTNNQIGGLFEILFLLPISPYWYLYSLFFVFLVTPTFKCVKSIFIGISIAVVGKAFVIIHGGGGGAAYMQYIQFFQMKYGLFSV